MNKCLCCNTDTKNLKFCSRSCSASYNNSQRVLSEETKAKIAKSVKANPTGVILDQTKRGQRISKTPNGIFKICEECGLEYNAGQYPSDAKSRKYCSVDCANLNKYHPNSTIVHRTMFENQQMDSGAELVFCKTLNEYKIKWDKNTTIGFPYTYNEKRGLYYPDFYLPEYDIWVETKGQRYIREGDEARRAAVGKEVILLITNNFKTELPAFISNILSRQKLF